MQSTVNCSDYSSGITSWLGYFEEGMFPPTSPLNMTVYASYLKALMEHSNALATIQINSLSSVNLGDSVSIVSSILSNVTPKFQQWVSSVNELVHLALIHFLSLNNAAKLKGL